jgi:hypothetical protein
LNDFVEYTQAVEVAPKSPPCCVPAVPLGDAVITLVFVIRLLMVIFGLLALLAPIQGGQDHPVDETTERKGFAC